jgi:hypothetical protein
MADSIHAWCNQAPSGARLVTDGVAPSNAMAGDGDDASLGMAGRSAIENPTAMGLLDFPPE